MLTKVDTLDDVLEEHASALGRDFDAYRNHAYRVVNLCDAFGSEAPHALEKVAIAGAFHDLGIWTEHTFDYLVPSAKLAEEYLARRELTHWGPEIEAMILEHHKLTTVTAGAVSLAETFRRADWADVTYGVTALGVPSAVLREIFATFPDAGFHARLAQLTFQRLLSHPTSPLPMLRW